MTTNSPARPFVDQARAHFRYRMFSLKNKTAIVTGAGSGIGRAIARLFSERGAFVAVVDVFEDAAAETVSSILESGGSASGHICDVGDQAALDDVFMDVIEAVGRLDILVNNAGVSAIGSVEETPEIEFDRVFATNVRGVYNGLRAGVRAMKPSGGVILNVASVAASSGVPRRFAYSMSKGAVVAMTYSVAVDYLEAGIRCNCISPARVHTPFVDDYLAREYPGCEAEIYEQLSRTQPIGRMGNPEEVAALALYLCSDEASFVTGSDYALDGGFLKLKR